MHSKVLAIIALILGSIPVSSSLAMPPAPGTYIPPPPTPAELWAASPCIAYGQILRVEIDATQGHSEQHNATLRVERCWKGNIQGDIRIEGPRAFDCYPRPFGLRDTHLLFLTPSPDGKSFLPNRIYDLQYQDGRPSFPSIPPNLFQSTENVPLAIHPLEIVEFLERTTGNIAEADSLLARIEPYRLEHRNRVIEAQQRKAQAFLDQSLGFFASALKEPPVKTRKILLEKLQSRLPSDGDERINKLKAEITAELSIVETYLKNGIRDFPSNTSVYPAPPG